MTSLKEIGETILRYDQIALFTHANADGDAVGSVLGLALSLRHMGKDVACFIPEPVPQKFSFLKGYDLINSRDIGDFKLAVLLDAAESARIKELEEHLDQFSEVINIDHHASNGHFANLNYVDKEAPSTTAIIFRLIEEAGFYIDSDIANALFTGLITDTGSFHYANTNEESFKVASGLVQKGASPDFVGRMVYEQDTVSRLKILGLALQRIVVHDFIAYSYITQQDLKDYSASEEDTDGIVDVVRKVKDTRLIILFKETKDGAVRVSLRGKDGFNVQWIATEFGGGGHPQASGCTLNLPMEQAISEVISKAEGKL